LENLELVIVLIIQHFMIISDHRFSELPKTGYFLGFI